MIDPLILAVALICGLALKRVGQPPLLGYLLAGFILHLLGVEGSALIDSVANAGVTLLLFSIGLKLNVRDLALPQVWLVGVCHMLVIVPILAVLVWAGTLFIPQLPTLSVTTILAIAFGLSFSSTVFAVKTFEDKGESAALFALIAIGILVIQDLIAVIFLTVNSGKVPSEYALLLFAIFLLKPLILRALKWCGHGELLTLGGFVLAFGVAYLFEVVNLKADLGALLAGVMLANSVQSRELSKKLLGFKDLFLIGFFLSIGLNGLPSMAMLMMALLLVAFIWIKPVLYFFMFVATRLRARTAFLGSLALFNYSEFGLIVIALAVEQGWLSSDWLVMMAVALSLSYLLASPINKNGHELYVRWRHLLLPFENNRRLKMERAVDIGGARVMVLGMGRVGKGAYEYLRDKHPGQLIGIEESAKKAKQLRNEGFNVVQADANDDDFWRFLSLQDIDLIMVSLSNHVENLSVVKSIQQSNYQGKIATITRFEDEQVDFDRRGCIAFNLYAEAGHGFAEHVLSQLRLEQKP